MGISRRSFIGFGAAAAICRRTLSAEGSARGVPERNRRPYADLDWSKIKQIKTTSHGHCTHQKMLDKFLARNFEFLTISNYYPSAPTCPGKTFRKFHYHVHHDWPVCVKGKWIDGPFDWNRIVEPWKDEIHKWHKKDYPFKEGEPLFPNWPDGMLEAPNAEHHNFIDPVTNRGVDGLHMCAPGSTFRSGTIDAHGIYGTTRRGYCSGLHERWGIALPKIFNQLVIPTGGGVTINHPRWTGLDFDVMERLLDFDPRVLGIEVYNFSSGKRKDFPYSDYWSLDYWDHALSGGRQCFGFSVPDWDPSRGVNVLCVEELSLKACLESYRQGNFYGAVFGDVARFTRIAFDGTLFVVMTDQPCTFALHSRKGIVATKKRATEFRWELPAGQAIDHVFLRLMAYPEANIDEVLFTQPQMLV